jgi:hypothetical protein
LAGASCAKKRAVSGDSEDARLVRPDGLAIRGLRHERGWSPRDLAAAIAEAERTANGRGAIIAPRVLLAVEERNAPIAYATLCLIAAGLDCNPVEVVLEDPFVPPPARSQM